MCYRMSPSPSPSPAAQRLFEACVFGNASAVDLLVGPEGVDPNALSSRGFRPLHFVVSARKTALIPSLLQAGADPRLHTASGVLNSIELALQTGQPAVARILEEAASQLHVQPTPRRAVA